MKDIVFAAWTVLERYSWYQEIPSGKDASKGALLINNIDSSISNEELNRMVKSYGEIKEVDIMRFSV